MVKKNAFILKTALYCLGLLFSSITYAAQPGAEQTVTVPLEQFQSLLTTMQQAQQAQARAMARIMARLGMSEEDGPLMATSGVSREQHQQEGVALLDPGDVLADPSQPLSQRREGEQPLSHDLNTKQIGLVLLGSTVLASIAYWVYKNKK